LHACLLFGLHAVAAAAGGAVKRNAELFFPAEFADDFPVSLQISERFGLVYVVTKLGLLFVYDLETATAVYRNRISPDPIFLACGSDSTGGILAINRCGRHCLSRQKKQLAAVTMTMLGRCHQWSVQQHNVPYVSLLVH
jgi:hypothetical protein